MKGAKALLLAIALIAACSSDPTTPPPSLDVTVASDAAAPAGNHPPVVQPVPDQTAIEGIPLALLIRATDPDGDAVALAADGLPDGATFDAGVLVWTPGYDLVAAALGSTSLVWTFTATDPAGLTASLAVNVTVLGDEDHDGIPDGEDGDIDGDLLANSDEVATDPLDPDTDDDGVLDGADNCPLAINPDQTDTDGDGRGDACDGCPGAFADDPDGDSACAGADNCPDVANEDQKDGDADGLGDACDACPADATNDGDGDGLCGVPPAVDAGPDVTATEGTAFSAVGHVVDADSTAWTVTADYGDGPVPLDVAADGSFTMSYVFSDNGAYKVTVAATDETGASAADASIVTVSNVAPSVDAGGDAGLPEGGVIARIGAFADPGADTWTATVDYGDGKGQAPLALDGLSFSLSHLFPVAGDFTVTVRVTDDDGGIGVAAFTAKVSGEAPVVDAGPDVTVAEGATWTGAGAFSDPGAGGHTATVDYGEGPEPLALAADATFTLSHTFADDGEHLVTVVVTDAEGHAGTDTLVVTATNVAPAVALGPSQVADAGATVAFAGAVTDPGADTFVAGVDYGDGVTEAVTLAEDGTFALAHAFATPGVYAVTVTVTDDDGGAGEASSTVTIPSGTIAVDAGPDVSVGEGTAFKATGSFTATAVGPFAATVDFGDGTAEPVALAADGTFALEHAFGNDGVYVVSVSVTGGSEAGADLLVVTVLNLPPAVDAGLDATVLEGAPFTSAAAMTDPGGDPLAVLVDYGDGSKSTSPALSHVYADNGTYTVTITATDDAGLSATDALTVTVQNVAPVVVAGPSAKIAEASLYQGAGSVTDPGKDSFTATVDYGDGPEPLAIAADRTFALAHFYPSDGTFVVTVTVTDDDGGMGTFAFPVTVGNVPNTVLAGDDATVKEGSTWMQAGAVQGPAKVASILVDHGDGSQAPAALDDAGAFTMSHVWADDGTYVVTATATDVDGEESVDVALVTVTNAPPAIALQPTADALEGSPFDAVGQISDPGSADTHSATVDYGDGAVPLALDGTGFTLSHAYLQSGEYTVKVSVKDDDGGSALASLVVTAGNVAPVVAAGDDATVAEGSVFEALAHFTDPGVNAFTATVDYGDGGGPTGAPVALDRSIALAHVYADDGVYNVTISVNDAAATGSGTRLVTVTNVAPSPNAGPEATVLEGQAFTRTSAAFDPGADTLSGTVDWGAGPEPLVVGADGGYALAHVFGKQGTWPVTVQIADDDGGAGTESFVVTVENVAPMVDAGDDAVIVEGDTFTATGQVTDPGAESWTATVDYGDGPEPLAIAADGTFALNHTFTAPGVVLVHVTDDDGATGDDSVTVTVNGVAPVVSAGADAAAKEGAPFSQSGTFADPGAGPWTVTADYGDGTVAPVALGDDGELTLAHTWAQDGLYSVSVTVVDSSGLEGKDVLVVSVANVAPAVTLDGAAAVDEGTNVTLSGAFVDPGADEWTASIAFGDGATSPLALAEDHTFSSMHAYADEGIYTVAATVEDGDGGSGEATAEVTVVNVAPLVTAGPDVTVAEGSPFTAAATFTDPGADDWTAMADYGDGPEPAGVAGKTISLAHTFADDGAVPVTVNVADGDGGTSEDTVLVTVENVAPAVSAGADLEVPEGTAFTRAVTFTDPGADTFTATVDYGDGGGPLVVPAGDGVVLLEHAYGATGVFQVTVTVTDDDGGASSDSFLASAKNVAPAVDAGGDLTVDEGAEATVTATFVDPVDVAHTAVIDWGDGAESPADVDETAHTASATHAYADDALRLVTVTVTDDDGDSGDATLQVTVKNVPPKVDAGGPGLVTDLGKFTRQGSFTDPGADTWTATVNYGDASPTVPLALAADKTFELAHTYAAGGQYTVTITVTDDDGGAGVAKISVRNCTTPVAATRRWVGGAADSPNVWTVAKNWAPAAVPAAADVAFVCAGKGEAPVLAANATIKGLIVDPDASMSISGGKTLTVTGDVAGGTVGGSGTLRMTGGAALLRGTLPKLVIDGTVTLSGATTTTGSVTIDTSRKLIPKGSPLVIGGNLTETAINGVVAGLIMTNPSDNVTVKGNASFDINQYQGSATTAGAFTAGVLHLHGNLTQYTAYQSSGLAFASTGTHVIFDGTKPQTVSFDTPSSGGSRFHDVTVSNAAGVTFGSSVVVMGQLTMAKGGALVQTTPSTYFATSLPVTSPGYQVKNNRAYGSVVMQADATLPNGGNLFIDKDRSLSVNGKSLLVDGSLIVTLDNDSKGLVMNDVADAVAVNGNVSFDLTEYQGSASTSGRLTAGVLRVRGNFTQGTAYQSSSSAFVSTGTRVVFDGTKAQSVSFQTPSTSASRFRDVDVSNPAGVTFASSVVVSGLLRMVGAGRLIQSAVLHTYVNSTLPEATDGYEVYNTRVYGALTLTEPKALLRSINSLYIDAGARLTVNGQSLLVGGSLGVTIKNPPSAGAPLGLVMTHPDDAVTLGGGASFKIAEYQGSASTASSLTNGVLEVRGDFTQSTAYQSSGSTFRSAGTRVRLAGTTPQTVSFATPGLGSSHFHDLEIANPAGVKLATTIVVTGQLSMTPDAVLTQAATVHTYVSSALPRTSAGYKVANTRVAGTIVMAEPASLPNGGNLFVDASRRLEVNGQVLDVSGGLYSTCSNGGGDGIILNHANDEVLVGGVAQFDVPEYHGSANTAGSFTAGVMRLRGGFNQLTSYQSTGKTFVSTGTRVSFEGTKPQAAKFANPFSSSFASVDVATTGGVTFGTHVVASGRLSVVGGIVHQAASLGTYLTTRLPDVQSGTYDVVNTHASGNVIVDIPVTLPQANNHLLVDPGAKLTVGGSTVKVGGNLTVTLNNTASSGLVMTHPLDQIEVGGNARFDVEEYKGSATNASVLTKGVLRLRGNFTQANAYQSSGQTFACNGTRVVFDGAKAQAVSFENPGADASRFSDVTVFNTAGVTFNTSVFVKGLLTMAGGVLKQGSSVGTYVTSAIPAATVGTYDVVLTRVAGNVVMDTDRVLPLPQNRLIVDPGASLKLAGHHLDVGGQLTVYLTNAATSGLWLTDSADVLTVGGAATFTTPEYNGSATSSGKLTAGELRFRGGFSQLAAYQGSGLAFVATGTKTIFDGTTAQSVSFTSPGTGSSRFADVEVRNPAGVTFATTVVTTGRPSVAAGGVLHQASGVYTHATTALPFATDGTWDVATTVVEGNVAMTEDISMPLATAGLLVNTNRTLAIGAHKLNVGGAFTVSLGNGAATGLVMKDAAGELTVGGLATFRTPDYNGSATSSGQLTAGTLRLRGGFSQTAGYQGSANAFVATGTQVVFDGNKAQSVAFQNVGTSRFHHVAFEDTAGVSLSTNVVATGQLRGSAPGLVKGLGRSLSVVGLDAAGTTFDHVLLTTTGGALARFEDVTFKGYAAGETQLTLNHTAATATFKGLTFLTTPNASGRYLVANDTNGPGTPSSLAVTESLPAYGMPRVSASGGFAVTWGAATDDGDQDGVADAAEYGAGTNPALADTDGDGWDDGAEAALGTNATSPVSAPALFAAPKTTAAGAATGLAAGLLNGDVRPDLAVTDAAGDAVRVLLQDPAAPGTFLAPVAYPVGAGPTALAVGDVDGDGYIDLVSANHGGGDVSYLRQDPAAPGTFLAAVAVGAGAGPSGVALANLGGDESLDLVVANEGDDSVTVRLWAGGTFQSAMTLAAAVAPSAIVVASLDGNTRPDLAATCAGSDVVSVWLQAADGTFPTRADVAVGAGPAALAAGDLNGDGSADLAVANETAGTVTLLYADPSTPGAFLAPVTLATLAGPRALALAPIDAGATVDLAVACTDADAVRILARDGAGAYHPLTLPGESEAGEAGVIVLDLDGNGKIDVVTANSTTGNVATLLRP